MILRVVTPIVVAIITAAAVMIRAKPVYHGGKAAMISSAIKQF
jgi:hypothetical protein